MTLDPKTAKLLKEMAFYGETSVSEEARELIEAYTTLGWVGE